jgi:hypothetical protein
MSRNQCNKSVSESESLAISNKWSIKSTDTIPGVVVDTFAPSKNIISSTFDYLTVDKSGILSTNGTCDNLDVQSKVIRRRFAESFPNFYDDVVVIDSDAKIDWGLKDYRNFHPVLLRNLHLP